MYNASEEKLRASFNVVHTWVRLGTYQLLSVFRAGAFVYDGAGRPIAGIGLWIIIKFRRCHYGADFHQSSDKLAPVITEAWLLADTGFRRALSI